MGYIFVQPGWFFTYSIILQAIFAVITMIVSFYAFKIYKLSQEKQTKLFSIAFFFISVSYIAQFLLNLLVLSRLDDDFTLMIQLKDVFLLNLFGLYAHALFFIVGLIILTYVTLKVENSRVLSLAIILVLISVFFSANKLFMFYVLSCVLLIHIVIYYFINYIKNKKCHTLIILIAMLCLLVSSFQFIFAIDSENYYVIGHILEFVAYGLILTNLLLVFKNGKKKR